MSRSVYLAGPIQHADDGGHGWRERVVNTYDGVAWVNPLDKYDAHATAVIVHRGDPPGDSPDDAELVAMDELVQADKDLIWRSDALLVGWDDVPSCGTPMEVMLAYHWRKPVAVWYDGEGISPWMEYHSGYVSDSLEACVKWLTEEAEI